MKNPKAETMTQIADTSQALADRYFGMAKPAIEMRNQEIFNALGLTPGNVMGLGARAGEPAYVARAFEGQRTGITDQLALNSRLGVSKAIPGSTNSGWLTRGEIGAQIARAATGSSINQAMSKIEQTSKLIDMGLTGASQIGSASMAAGRNALEAASMMPTTTQGANTLATVLSGAATAYGAADKMGLFAPGSAPPTASSVLGMGPDSLTLGLQPSSMAPVGWRPETSIFSPISSLTTAPTTFGFGNAPTNYNPFGRP